MPRPQKPMALPRSCGGNASSSTACESGCKQPPLAPCMMRKRMSVPSVGASPHKKDDAVKPTTDSMSSRFRPNRLASQPVIGRMIALATRYDVSAQVASSIVADRLPAMCGSETLTTVVSSTSMNVANITEIAIIQGLMGRSVKAQLSSLNSQIKSQVSTFRPSTFKSQDGQCKSRCGVEPRAVPPLSLEP